LTNPHLRSFLGEGSNAEGSGEKKGHPLASGETMCRLILYIILDHNFIAAITPGSRMFESQIIVLVKMRLELRYTQVSFLFEGYAWS